MPQPVPPVWLMRQAGRYERHYQQLRARHSFQELCHEPELAGQLDRGQDRSERHRDRDDPGRAGDAGRGDQPLGSVAADVSEVMLARLRRKVDDAGVTNVDVVQAGFVTYEHLGPPADVVYTTGRDIRITTDAPIPLQIDGDSLGTTPAHVRLLDKPVAFIVS